MNRIILPYDLPSRKVGISSFVFLCLRHHAGRTHWQLRFGVDRKRTRSPALAFLRQKEKADKKRAEEEADKKRAEEEANKRRAEEEAKANAAAEEARKVGRRGEYFDAMSSDSRKIVDGMKDQCIAASWLDRVGEKLNELVSQKITDAHGTEAGASEITSSTPLKFTVNNCTTNFRLAFKPQVDRLKSMADNARIGYLSNILAKNQRDRGWKPSTWTTTLDDGAVVTYTFKPTGMKDAGQDAVVVIGKVDVEIVPAIKESTRRRLAVKNKIKINESQRITLTIGQLKRLIRESRSAFTFHR